MRIHVENGMALAVKSSLVGVVDASLANGSPCFVLQINVLGKDGVGGNILCVKFRIGGIAVHQCRKPEEVAGIPDLIDPILQFCRLIESAFTEAVGIVAVGVHCLVGVVIGIGQSKNIGIVEIDDFLVISIGDGVANSLGHVALFHASRDTLEEEQVGGPGGACVAVGHIHQIVFTVQRYDIPHMAARAGAALHDAVDGVAGNPGQIAQVLECLGIALADHVGGGIPVKDIDQLPGIAVGRALGIGSFVVITGQVTDSILVGQQFFIGGFVLVLGHNLLGLGQSSLGRTGFGGIHPIGRTIAVGLGNSHLQGDSCYGDFSVFREKTVRRFDTGSFVKPVQIGGAVYQQTVYHLAEVGHFIPCFTKCGGEVRVSEILDSQLLIGPGMFKVQNNLFRTALFALGHLLNICPEGVVDGQLVRIQGVSDCTPVGHRGRHTVGVHLLLQIEGKQLFVIGQASIGGVYRDFLLKHFFLGHVLPGRSRRVLGFLLGLRCRRLLLDRIRRFHGGHLLRRCGRDRRRRIFQRINRQGAHQDRPCQQNAEQTFFHDKPPLISQQKSGFFRFSMLTKPHFSTPGCKKSIFTIITLLYPVRNRLIAHFPVYFLCKMCKKSPSPCGDRGEFFIKSNTKAAAMPACPRCTG